MPSTNKTPHLGLNDWNLTDKPEMADFNEDNRIIDQAVSSRIPNREFLSAEVISVDIGNLRNTIMSLPRYRNANLTINVNPGTITDEIPIDNFDGPGSITINGAGALSNSHTVRNFVARGNTNSLVHISGFNCSNTDRAAVNIINEGTANIWLRFIQSTNGSNTTNANRGVTVGRFQRAFIFDSLFSNKHTVISGEASTCDITTGGLQGENNGNIFTIWNGTCVRQQAANTVTGNTWLVRGNGAFIQDQSGWYVQNGQQLGPRVINNVPLSELQHLINSLPKYLSQNIIINTLPGTIDQRISIERFSGPGDLIVNGSTNTLADTHNVPQISVRFCFNARVEFNGFNLTNTDPTIWALYATNSFHTRFQWMQVTGNGGRGALAYRVPVFTANNILISNQSTAISVSRCSQASVWNISGENNNIGYEAINGGILSLGSSLTMSATILRREGAGGIIFPIINA